MIKESETETGHYRWNDKEVNECYTRFVILVNRLQILLRTISGRKPV